MIQPTAINPSRQAEINLALRAALRSLDLDLATEIERYRRFKRKNQLVHSTSYLQAEPVTSPEPEQELPNKFTDLVHQPSEDLLVTPDGEMTPLEDYLESSENLLLSLSDRDSFSTTEVPLLNPVTTPLGISSLLIFLLATSLLGLALIPKANVLELSTNVKPAEKTEELKAEVKINNRQNLAVREFQQLSLNNISTIKPASRKTVTKTPEKSKTVTSVTSHSKTGSKDYYYVFIDYGNDRSLTEARKIVSDAYIRKLSEGTRIQMGAFYTFADADRLVRQLSKQGITAYVESPQG